MPGGSDIGRERGADVKRTRLAAALGAAWLLVGTPSVARAEDDDPTAWRVTAIPYLWAAGLYGDVTVRGVDAHLDASFLDLVDHTDTLVGLEGHLEVARGPLGVYGDFFYVRTKVEDAGVTGLDVTTKMWFIEFGAQYRVFDTTTDRVPGLTFDVYAGGRYTNLELDLDPVAGPSLNQQVDWIDPLVGARLGVHFSEHVFVLLAGDVGGFGVGSDVAWSVMGLLGYRWEGAGLEWAVLAGYKALGQDYTTGSGLNRFRWDVTMHGPILGLSIRF
jgi:hypothetical protein